ncbi:MAG TPA: LLM class flavin-dependent oxidoreductase [Acidobacteriaceae bacterium]
MAPLTRLPQTPLSVLDLAHLRQGSTTADTFRNTLELARHAERLGYKRYWLAEHHNIAGVACSATSVLIGYVAGGTSKIRVGSGGIMLPNHAPLAIAEQFGTLETLYPGRIDLGLGRAPGGDSAVIRAFARDQRRIGDDFPELLAELRGLLAEPKPGQTIHAFPGEGTHVPVWLLGSSGFSAQLAGFLGLPFAFAAHFQPDSMMEALDLYRTCFRPSETLGKPYAMVGIPVIAADTDEKAERLATVQQQKFLNLIRNHPGPLMPPVQSLDWSPFEQAMVASKLRASIVGSRETVRQKLEAFLEETQADELMIATDTFEQADRLRSFEILAGLRGAAVAEPAGVEVA